MNLFLITFIPALVLGFVAAFLFNVWRFNAAARRMDRFMMLNPNVVRIDLGDNAQVTRPDQEV